jgi:hypothetical protein
MLFCAVGKSREVATATWDSARWCNIHRNLILNWSEMKTGDSDPMNFWPDFQYFEFQLFIYIYTCTTLKASRNECLGRNTLHLELGHPANALPAIDIDLNDFTMYSKILQ